MLTPRAKAYILHHIRLAWRYYSEERKAVVKKPCGVCGAKPPSLADHVEPVVDPKKGFEDFEVYVFRMFNKSLQPLCKECHDKKTKAEAQERKARRKLCSKSRSS
ncbi:MAG: hypothetical protein E6Q97_06740 [Desulfurellales bacterium]|nr:MAG: hypothetical protein E6Q97_06740 [Desulfurellales bacterium]